MWDPLNPLIEYDFPTNLVIMAISAMATAMATIHSKISFSKSTPLLVI